MLNRKIEKVITEWIKNDEKALLLTGARQVGKTYIIRQTLKKHNCHYLEFNLLKSPELVDILSNASSIDDLVSNLSLFTTKPIVRGNTFIFFDEIQEFSDIITKIKFWVDEGSLRFVLSGSLLGVELRNISSAPVGYLKMVTMYPLDFEEFLQIYNFTNDLKESLYKSFVTKTPVNESIHSRMIQLFHLYLNVGGMPAAVQKFADTKNLETVMHEHLEIIAQYKYDFTKYEIEQKRIYLTRIYDLISAELNKPNKRFILADMKKGLRYDRSTEDFLWLSAAGVALPVYNVSQPTMPLILNENNTLFKLFLSDVGMLTTMYGRATKMQILTSNNSINFGAIYENVVAQELIAHGFKLYYYNSKRFGELDFVIEHNGKVLPFEIKSGKDYKRHSALSNVLNVLDYNIDEAFVFTNYNIEVGKKCTYYPIYMLMFIDADEITLPVIDIPVFG